MAMLPAADQMYAVNDSFHSILIAYIQLHSGAALVAESVGVYLTSAVGAEEDRHR